MFDELETDNLKQLRLMRHMQNAAASAYGDSELYKHHYEACAGELKTVGQLLFPWVDWASDGKASEYKKEWEEWFGIKVGSREWEDMERRSTMIQKYLGQDKEGKRGSNVIS